MFEKMEIRRLVSDKFNLPLISDIPANFRHTPGFNRLVTFIEGKTASKMYVAPRK